MDDDRPTITDRIEPDVGGNTTPVLASIAISLKRIADNIDKLTANIVKEECKHRRTTSRDDHHTCNDCGAFITDSSSSWGSARMKPFKSREAAELYKRSGWTYE